MITANSFKTLKFVNRRIINLRCTFCNSRMGDMFSATVLNCKHCGKPTGVKRQLFFQDLKEEAAKTGTAILVATQAPRTSMLTEADVVESFKEVEGANFVISLTHSPSPDSYSVNPRCYRCKEHLYFEVYAVAPRYPLVTQPFAWNMLRTAQSFINYQLGNRRWPN